jgi:hypothetical protein
LLPANQISIFVATDHDKSILEELSAEWGMVIDESLLKHGFSWPIGDLQADLEHTSEKRHMRERNLGLAKSALLTVAHARKLYGNEIILPNDFNGPEVAHVHQWTKFGDGFNSTHVSSPEEIEYMALEFFRTTGPESVDRSVSSSPRYEEDSFRIEQASPLESPGLHGSGRSLNAQHSDSKGKHDSEEEGEDPDGPTGRSRNAKHTDSYGQHNSEEEEEDPDCPDDGIQGLEKEQQNPYGSDGCDGCPYFSDND